MASVLVVSAEPLGPLVAGPSIRALELARALAGRHAVTIAAPGLTDSGIAGVEALDAGFEDYERLTRAIGRSEVVVAQALPARVLGSLPASGARLVADLYNPTVFEVLEAGREKDLAARRRQQREVTLAAGAMVAAASRIMCASESQRDLWLGFMAALGRVPVGAYDRDPTFRSFVDVVPFGIPDEPPRPAAVDPVREMFPAIGPEDAVALWGGGVWNWLDPQAAIDAIGLLDSTREAGRRVHLVFMGLGRPSGEELDAMAATGAMERHLASTGLEGRCVHVNRGWVPYAERGEWLAASDIALSAHRDHLESRLAFRTRLVDAIWAGLPIVATSGDAIAAEVESKGMGRTCRPGDPEALALAVTTLVDDPAAMAAARESLGEAAASLSWSDCARPLKDWCEHPDQGLEPDRGLLRRMTLARYPGIVAETVETDGAPAAARRIWTNARRAVRRGR